MRETSPIALIGKGERIRESDRNMCAHVLSVLTVWISSTGFEQPLILASFINGAYGQQESPSSQGSTPFLEWYSNTKP